MAPYRFCLIMLLHRADGIDVDLPAGRIEHAQERTQVGAARDELPAIFAPDALDQRGRGTNHVGLRQAKPLDPILQALIEEQGLVLAAVAVLVAESEFSELAKRWIAVIAPCLDLGCVELVIVVARGRIDTKVLRIEGLDDDAPGLCPASRAPGDLCEQRKGAFGGGKVGQVQRDIRLDHAHQRYPRQVKPFGDHLRADENVGLAVGEAIKQLLMCVPVARRVAVPAQQARRGEAALDRILHLLRAQAEVANARTAACRAEMQDLVLPAAIMAEQHAFRGMIGQGDIAAITERHEAAIATEYAACRATAIQKEDRLLAQAQGALKLFLQAAADDAGVAGVQLSA